MSSSLWNFFFYWTISGSVFYLFNFLLHPLEKRLLPPILRNWLLRVNVFIFLIPMPRYVYRFKNLYSEILKVEFPPKLSFHITVGSYITVPFRDEYILLPEEGRIILIAFLLWSAGAVAHIVRYTILYRRFKKVILHNPRNHPLSASSADYQLIADICRRLKLRKKPHIFMVQNLQAPFTCGFFKRRLYVPSEWEISPELYEIVLYHELAHIKRMDSLYKILAVAAIIIHWYNPIIYLLFFSLNNSNEFTADSIALKGCDYMAVKDYAALILSLCCSNSQNNFTYSSGLFSGRKLFLKERILNMKNQKKFKCKKPVFSLILLLSLMLSSTSVLGYHDPISIPADEFGAPIEGSEIIISTEPLDTPEILDFSESDTILIDDQGNIFYENSETKSSCNHTFTTGQMQHHSQKTDGGCMVDLCKIVFCTQCQLIRSQEYINTLTYKICPH